MVCGKVKRYEIKRIRYLHLPYNSFKCMNEWVRIAHHWNFKFSSCIFFFYFWFVFVLDFDFADSNKFNVKWKEYRLSAATVGVTLTWKKRISLPTSGNRQMVKRKKVFFLFLQPQAAQSIMQSIKIRTLLNVHCNKILVANCVAFFLLIFNTHSSKWLDFRWRGFFSRYE